MTAIKSNVDTASAEFQANQTAMRAFIAGLQEHRARRGRRAAALPRASPVARETFAARPGDDARDPGTPFLELSPLAANGMYEDAISGRDYHRHRAHRRARVRDRLQRFDGQGRHLLSDDRQEAPSRAGSCAREPVTLHLSGRFRRRQSAAMAEVFPDREHFGRIFYNQATCRPRALPR